MNSQTVLSEYGLSSFWNDIDVIVNRKYNEIICIIRIGLNIIKGQPQKYGLCNMWGTAPYSLNAAPI